MIYFGDVDVVMKLAACGFLPLLPELLGIPPKEFQLRYLPSLRARLTRTNKKLSNLSYQKHLVDFCAAHAEIDGAADTVRQDELMEGGMDIGEAILFAEAEATRGIVVTGDKRALLAYAQVSSSQQRAKLKVICWEQLLLRVKKSRGFEELRAGCCAALGSDGLLSLAFSSGLATEEDHAIAAIESYLGAVRKHSAEILVPLEL